jgi:hypothetical protein
VPNQKQKAKSHRPPKPPPRWGLSKKRTKINNLKTINIDIETDELKIKSIDLFFVGLVLEYVEPTKVLKEINRS